MVYWIFVRTATMVAYGCVAGLSRMINWCGRIENRFCEVQALRVRSHGGGRLDREPCSSVPGTMVKKLETIAARRDIETGLAWEELHTDGVPDTAYNRVLFRSNDELKGLWNSLLREEFRKD